MEMTVQDKARAYLLLATDSSRPLEFDDLDRTRWPCYIGRSRTVAELPGCFGCRLEPRYGAREDTGGACRSRMELEAPARWKAYRAAVERSEHLVALTA